MWWRIRALVAGDRAAHELREEMRFHQELLAEEYARRGVSARDAADAARRRFGNTTYLTEESRSMWRWTTVDSLLQDVRYAARSLRASPTFTLAAALTLALGIGATTAIFGIVDAVMLRPLPYRSSEQLVSLYSTQGRQAGQRVPPSHPDFLDWSRQASSFEGMVFARGESLLRTDGESAERITVGFMSDGFFPLLGIAPELGRAIQPDDERAGAPPVLVLAHRTWMSSFGGDPAVVGRTITTDRGVYTVVGVMPDSFRWPEWASSWAPLASATFLAPALAPRDFRVDNRVLARLRPGVPAPRVSAELDAIARRLAAEHPKENTDWSITTVSLRDEIVGPVQRPLWILLGAVTGLLLIACANVGNLSLARASSRVREVGVRMTLGASRVRVVRQLLVESTVLALAGGVLGVVVARFAIDALVRLAPPDLPRMSEVALDLRVLGAAFGMCLVAALLFGIAPALHVSAQSLTSAVKEGGRGSGRGRRGARMRTGFVIVEIALASALVIGSVLLVKSFARIRSADPGFEPEHLLTLRLEPKETRYDTPARLLALFDAIRDEVARVPGVRSASYVNHLPIGRAGVATTVEPDGAVAAPGTQPQWALYRLADSAFFRTTGQRVVRGHGFEPGDMTPSSTAILVNESLARQLWKDADPIGHRLRVFKQLGGRDDFQQPIDAQVIGIVRDITDFTLSSSASPEVYLPFTVNPWRSVFLVARTADDPAAVAPAVRKAVQRIDREIPVKQALGVDELMAMFRSRRRFDTTLVTAFGACALLLASLGIYGIVAYGVTQRRQEIGVRAALGAQPRDLLRLFVRQGLLLAAAGALAGTAIAAALGRSIESLLFGVAATDAVTYLEVALAIVIVAALASWIPALRATRVDPSLAMRGE